MADFEKAFIKVKRLEGGYVNDPRDAGGETFIGITRKYHRNSIIWKYVDEAKRKTRSPKELTSILSAIPEVMAEVKRIYKTYYWDILELDDFESQAIATQLFDDSVNRGIPSAIKLMQLIGGFKITGKISKELLDHFKGFKGSKA